MKRKSIISISLILTALFFLLILGNCGIGTKADEAGWPRWRGPDGDGISNETNWDPEALAGGPKILWKVDVWMGYSNVAIKDNRLYTMGIKGVYCLNAETDERFSSLRCLDVETGEVMWEEDFKRNPISLMAADGKLIILAEDGTLHIAEATPSAYKEISSADVLGGERKYERFWTPPVLYKGKIYCRDWSRFLICVDVSK